ncbi:MAG: TRAP transporter substrate-binding protein [Ostreibacterium sp.]
MKLTILKKLQIVLVALVLFATTSVFAQNFKMALGDVEGGTQFALGSKFAELLEKKTDGKVKIKLFPNSQLGSEQNTVNDAAMGLLDFSVVAINNVTPFSPTVGLLTMPYLIQTQEEARKLVQGSIGKKLVKNTIRDAKVRILGWSYSGFRVLTNSKRPVRTLDDLKGLVIRVPKNEIMIASYQAWGINPTPMAWSETFTALQQKVVDGQDNPYITVYAMKFNEVQKYITNIHYVFSLEPLIISESIFEKQPKELQKAILEAGKEATDYSYDYLIKTEKRIRKDLISKGMEITEPANGEKEWIKKVTEKVWPKFYDTIGGKEKLDNALKLLGR